LGIAWIFVAGQLNKNAELERFLAQNPASLIVAADGGILHAQTLGVVPDLWLGDFDSSDPALFPHIPQQSFPSEKDQLDSELALEVALQHGCTKVIFLGALGGRFDHTLALLLIGLKQVKQGVEVWLHSGLEWAMPFAAGKTYALEAKIGQTLSILALEPLEDFTFLGVKWPLNAVRLEVGSGWGMSNIALEECVSLHSTSGCGVVVFQALEG
jgi:thiamine pyrophosphokinase